MNSERPLKPSASGTLRELQLDSGPLSYQLIRARRRSIAIQAAHEGVRVRAPNWASIAAIEQFLRSQQQWIRDHLAASRSLQDFSWRAGAELPLLGGSVCLAPGAGSRRVTRHGDTLAVPAEGAAARGPVLAWIKREARVLFAQRIQVYAQRLGVAAPRLRLSNARTRWGSCSVGPAGPKVSLHWKLYLLPVELIDYVVAHELAHLRELNHSARFWSVVQSVYPEYRRARAELNRQGKALPIL